MLEFMSWFLGDHVFGKSPLRSLFSAAGVAALKSPQIRDLVLAYIKTNLDFGNYDAIVKTYSPIGIKREMAWYAYSFFKTLDRAAREGRLSARVQDRMINVLLWEAILNWGKGEHVKTYFHSRGEEGPPRFLIISPSKECNLRCEFCHTDSGSDRDQKLSYEEFHRVISEAEEKWSIHFFFISGGEPFLWKDGERGLLDLIAAHPDSFFMVHTNGTPIDDGIASRLAQLGTIIPTISVEGLMEHTDERRGNGTYDKIMHAMARLRACGVPFGTCLTATRANFEIALSDGFLSEMFERQGALYGLILHYFPVGRSISLDLIPTPEERSWMWERMHHIVREKGFVIADYLNSAPLFGGSIVAGRHNGYLHINWNGDVTPCTFLPFVAGNIRDVYAEGGSLQDIYESPFLTAIRDWQRSHGFDGALADDGHNWMMSCLIRDYFTELKELVKQHRPMITDPATRELLEKPLYEAWFADYARQFKSLTDPIWQQEYLQRA